MLDFLIRSSLLLIILGGGYGILLYIWSVKFALKLSLHISDSSTDVFDLHGEKIASLLNKVIYKKNPFEIVTFGKSIESTYLFFSENIEKIEELDLVRDVEILTKDPNLCEIWRTFVYFCCERARQQTGKGLWRYLDVRVKIKTSDPLIKHILYNEMEGKHYRSYGIFRFIDTDLED